MNTHSPNPSPQMPASIPLLDSRSEIDSLAELFTTQHTSPTKELAVTDAIAALTLIRQLRQHSTCRQQNANPVANLLLISPPTNATDCSVIAELTQLVPRISVTLDHFYHAELLSLAAAQTRRNIAVLPALETGRQLMGVRPGPDCHTLAQAVQQLPGITLRGLFASAQTLEQPGSQKPLPTAKVVALVQHNLAQLQRRGLPAHEAVIAADQPPPTKLNTTPTANSIHFCAPAWSCAATTPIESPESVAVTVLSRPALEYCVIAAGSRSGVVHQHTQVLLPKGASITSWSTHHAQLSLPSTALDLLIGQHAILAATK